MSGQRYGENDVECTCPANRPLGAPHPSSCPKWEFQDLATGGTSPVQVYRGDDGRPVAVPDEVVTQAEREYRAWKQYAQGIPWHEIAVTEGYPSAKAASEAVRRYLDEGRAIVGELRRREIVATELGVLLAARRALWAPAMDEGKVPAVMAQLAIHDRFVKLFGLDQPDPEDDPSSAATTVVVNEGTYTEDLRKAAGAEDEPLAG